MGSTHAFKGLRKHLQCERFADKTFEKIFAVAAEEEMYGTRLKIPILDHLLALKLHALKHGHIGRHMKDHLDLEGLIRVNHLDIKSEKMRTLFLKYGNLNIYEQVSRATESQ